MNQSMASGVTDAKPVKKLDLAALGPRQAKLVQEALISFRAEAVSFTELTGVIGKDEHTFSFQSPFSPGRADAGDYLTPALEAFEHKATAANYQDLIMSIEQATIDMRETRPVQDKRRTAEDESERIAESNRRAAEAEAKAREKAERESRFTRKHFDLVENAKACKRVLGVIFPGTAFFAKSDRYSGGNSIDVSWTDGPTQNTVNRVLDYFNASDFDGMQDLKTYRGDTEWNGYLLSFQGDHVRGSRKESKAQLEAAAARVAKDTATPLVPIVEERGWVKADGPNVNSGYSFHSAQTDEYPNGILCRDDQSYNSLPELVYQVARHTATEQPATLLDRDTIYSILLELHPQCQAVQDTPVEPTIGAAGVTVRENNEKNGVEILFAAKPATAILDRLKAGGFRWSRFSKCWYHKRSDASLALARSIGGVTAESQPAGEDYPCSDLGYEDECARRCGNG